MSKFQLRRGTDIQRQAITFAVGELVYITDTKKVYGGFTPPTAELQG
jgi:hypothetical protein